MNTPLLFRHAHIVTAQGNEKADVLIVNGTITELKSFSENEIQEIHAAHADLRTIDCMGMYLMPGAIDMHVHFRDPGATHKEDFGTGTLAAASGGVTTIVDMPNTNPTTTTMEALLEKRKIAKEKSLVNALFHFGATQEPYNIEEIKLALKERDVMGIKICMAKTTGPLLVTQTEKLEEILRVATEAGKFCIIHAEDNDEVSLMESRFANAIEPRTHSLIRNPMTAYAATKRIIHLAKKVEARVHITHLSTALEVEELKKCGHNLVTSDCTPHHLFFTDEAYSQWGNLVKVNPPLRFDEDKEALWQALNNGVIDCVATDHAPHTHNEKSGQYSEVPSGIPSVELMVPLLLDAVNHGQLNLVRVLELVSQNPAKILGLTTKGALEVGMDADLMLVDMNKSLVVGKHGGPHNGYFSKSGWSPYEGTTLKGWPVMTFVNGAEVWKSSL